MDTEQKFYKDRFKNIPLEKQEGILTAAVEEFAKNGFNGTSINKVAKHANISIGALYSYFDSKDDLFLTIVEKMFNALSSILDTIDTSKDFFSIVEQMFYSAHDYATKYPLLNQIYLDMSTQSLTNISKKISGTLETVTRDLYLEVIKNARDSGQINLDIDDRILSFLLDNLIVVYQFSFTSEYYKGRMQIFLGSTFAEDYHDQIKEIMKFIQNALTV
ncbi:MAG: TetR/AcrR family transcriptional regulator [Spirochaetaceae bacterium]